MKNNNTKKILILFLICFTFIFISCDKEMELTISNTDIELQVSEEYDLVYSCTENGSVVVDSTSSLIEVSVTNDKIHIKALKAGNCFFDISLKEDPTILKRINVTIYQVLQSIEIKENEKEKYRVNDVIILKALYSSVSDKNLKMDLSWLTDEYVKVENENDNEITLSLLKPGISEIKLFDKYSHLETTLSIDIKDNYSLVIDSKDISMTKGEKKELTYTLSNGTIEFKSSDENIVKVNNGVLESLSVGEAYIYVTIEEDNSIQESIKVNVLPKTLLEIGLDVPKDVVINTTFDFKPIYDDTCDTDFIVEYDTEVLEYKDGVFTAIKEGNTSITLKDKVSGLETSKSVNIYELSTKAVTNYFESIYFNKVISEDTQVIKNYYNSDLNIHVELYYDDYFTLDGKYTAPIIDIYTEIYFEFTINNELTELFIPIIIKGWGNEFDVIFAYLDRIVPKETRNSINLTSEYYEYKASITWYEQDKLIENNTYTFVRDDRLNYDVTLKAKVTIGDVTREKEYTIRLIMLDSMNKLSTALDSVAEYYDSMEIVESITLKTKDDDYGVKFEWTSYSPNIISSTGEYTKPFTDTQISMMLFAKCGIYEKYVIIYLKVKGENYMEKWEKIQGFLERINKKEIKTQVYYLYGWEEGYESVLTKNIGYLPFYLMDEVKITVDILPDNSPLKANEMRKETKFICLHNTGMAHPTATAYGLNEYIHTTDRVASWHFSVDDKEAYQELKLGEVGWHAGDGSRTYQDIYYNDTYGTWCTGGGNRNSVGIEMCVYAGCDFNMVMRNTAKIVSSLLVTYNLKPSDVRQHHDFSGKNCPQVIRAANRWNEMLELIDLEYYARTELKDVVFTFKSLSPEYMDDTGKIINNPKTMPEISYQVTVKADGEEKVFTYKSKLLSI